MDDVEKEYLDRAFEIVGKIECDKENQDRWTMIPKLPFWKRVYKKLFPLRYEVREKVKAYFYRKATTTFYNKVDTFLAWGDEVREVRVMRGCYNCRHYYEKNNECLNTFRHLHVPKVECKGFVDK